MTALDTATLEALEADFVGELVRPDDPTYDDTRKVWNGHIDRRPALIARCRGVADVIAAVRFARENDLLTAVRGGGHAVAGYALCDDGIVIDLSLMTGSRVDPLARTRFASREVASTTTSTARARRSVLRSRAASSVTRASRA
jgi:FAD/FMN-containing dehydrogenase